MCYSGIALPQGLAAAAAAAVQQNYAGPDVCFDDDEDDAFGWLGCGWSLSSRLTAVSSLTGPGAFLALSPPPTLTPPTPRIKRTPGSQD
jgi:hypothetical protein